MRLMALAAVYRDPVRRVINVEREYMLRRLAYRALPAAPSNGHYPRLHCCVWKTGSQWLRLVLSDPNVYRASGCLPYVGAEVTDPSTDSAFKNRPVVLVSLFWSASRYDAFRDAVGGARGIFVVRDPRDLLVSWYRSTRFHHDLNPWILEQRAAMAGMSDDDAHAYMIDRFDGMETTLRTWVDVQARDDVAVFRYEDLTGPDSIDHLAQIFAHLHLDLPRGEVEMLGRRYHISGLRAGGSGGKKYAAGRSGQWRGVLSRANLARFEERFGYLVSGFGYV